ncbi:MAG TPA: pyruvate kinase [Thermomicrobiales bacterium]|nr:pyruvate kinase [Thermomicrobiales bacterium]
MHPLTKIVATIGPATSSREQLEALIDGGVSVIRLNFSHGSQDDHEAVYAAVREISHAKGRPVAILQDLQGPKLRIGDLVDGGPVVLERGGIFRLCTAQVQGTAIRASVSYADLGRDVRPGDTILLDDGHLELLVEDVERDTPYGDEVITTVVHGGKLKPQKGMNLPGTVVSSPSMTEKDLEDLEFGVRLGVDMIALSFVREVEDVRSAQEKIRSLGGSQPLIAKIEKPQAVKNLEAIVREVEGVMVARGDLGVEMRPEMVPLIQKRLIALANREGIPVITATQMLESMIVSPRPTRAEASDVANAVFDGTDAVMLSGETAVGAYPLEAVRIMGRIAKTVEQDSTWRASLRHEAPEVPVSRDAVAAAKAATSLAESIGAAAIAVLTETGRTAQRISQARPGIPIAAFTEHEFVANRLALWHGVVPVIDPLDDTIEGLVTRVDRRMQAMEIANAGETIVVIGAVPRSNGAQSVFLEIHHMDEQ